MIIHKRKNVKGRIDKVGLEYKHLKDLRVKMIYKMRYILEKTHTFTLIKWNLLLEWTLL